MQKQLIFKKSMTIAVNESPRQFNSQRLHSNRSNYTLNEKIKKDNSIKQPQQKQILQPSSDKACQSSDLIDQIDLSPWIDNLDEVEVNEKYSQLPIYTGIQVNRENIAEKEVVRQYKKKQLQNNPSIQKVQQQNEISKENALHPLLQKLEFNSKIPQLITEEKRKQSTEKIIKHPTFFESIPTLKESFESSPTFSSITSRRNHNKCLFDLFAIKSHAQSPTNVTSNNNNNNNNTNLTFTPLQFSSTETPRKLTLSKEKYKNISNASITTPLFFSPRKNSCAISELTTKQSVVKPDNDPINRLLYPSQSQEGALQLFIKLNKGLHDNKQTIKQQKWNFTSRVQTSKINFLFEKKQPNQQSSSFTCSDSLQINKIHQKEVIPLERRILNSNSNSSMSNNTTIINHSVFKLKNIPECSMKETGFRETKKPGFALRQLLQQQFQSIPK